MNSKNIEETTLSTNLPYDPLIAYVDATLQPYHEVLQIEQIAETSKAICTAIETAVSAALSKHSNHQSRYHKKIKVVEEICPSKAITYSPFYIDTVLPELLKHFAAEQHPQLTALVKSGIEPEVPLQFRGRANQLIEFFKRAKYNRHLTCYSNTPLQEWICKYFNYQTVDGYARFNPSTIAEILKSTEKEGKGNNHILIDVLPYKDPKVRLK